MKINQSKGDYLKTDEDGLKGSIITILDEGTIEVSDKYRYENADGSQGEFRKSLVFLVEHLGKNRKLRMNAGSKISCVEAWGDESKDWVGKKATVHILPTPKGDKKMIVLDPIVSKDAKTAQNATKIEDVAWGE